MKLTRAHQTRGEVEHDQPPTFEGIGPVGWISLLAVFLLVLIAAARI